LAHVADHTYATLSSGERVRALIARALAVRPGLLLLDEPTAGLDALGFEVLAELIAQARARNTAVVLASHVLSDLSDHCDEVAVLLGGRIQLAGTPQEILGGTSLSDIYRRHVAHAT